MAAAGDGARHDHVLTDGTRVILRPIDASDGARLRQGFERLSPESRYRRFFTAMPHLPDRVLDHLLDVDGEDRVAWAALEADVEGEPGIGVARYYRLRDEPDAAEAAVAVTDDFQRRGVGGLLLRHLSKSALDDGITRFVGTVLVENKPMLDLVRAVGGQQKWTEPGVVRVEIDIRDPAPVEEPDGIRSALFRVLRAIAAS